MAKQCTGDYEIWSQKKGKCISLIKLAKKTSTWKQFGGDKLEKKIRKVVGK